MKNICFFIICLLVMASCLDEPDCVREAHDEVSFRFKRADNGSNRNVLFDSVSVGSDSLLYDSVRTSLVAIPLYPFGDETTVVFYSSIGTDTINLGYRRITRLISTNCGMETFFLDLEVKDHTFDSLRITKRNIIADGNTNFEIFY